MNAKELAENVVRDAWMGDSKVGSTIGIAIGILKEVENRATLDHTCNPPASRWQWAVTKMIQELEGK